MSDNDPTADAVDIDGQDGAASTVGVRELRRHLADHLRRAQRGERLVVAVGGQPVAELGPLRPVPSSDLAALVAAGLIEPPRRSDPVPVDADSGLGDGAVDQVLARLRGR